MSANMTREDVQKELRGVVNALGTKIGEKLAENRSESIEATRQLEELIKAQGSEIRALATRDGMEYDENGDAVPGSGMGARLDYAGQDPREKLENLRSSRFGDGIGRSRIPGGDARGLLAMRTARVLAGSANDKDRGVSVHDYALGVAQGWGDRALIASIEENRELVSDLHGSDVTKKKVAERALGTDTLAGGGAVIQAELSSMFLDILHARTVVRNAGALVLPLPTGVMGVPFLDTGATASWDGENAGSNATAVTHGKLNFQRRILRALVPVSNQLLTESSYAYDAFLRDHMINQLKKKEDLGMLRGDGMQNAPYGISYWADLQSNASNRSQSDASGSTVDEITADLCTALGAIEGADVQMLALAIFTSIRDKYGLFRLRDGNNNLVFAEEMRAGTLMGAHFDATSQIPITLDASGNGDNDESEVYVVDVSTCAIAEKSSLEFREHPYGTYKNSSGTMESGLTNDQTVFEAKHEMDFACLYRGKEAYRLDVIDWGA